MEIIKRTNSHKLDKTTTTPPKQQQHINKTLKKSTATKTVVLVASPLPSLPKQPTPPPPSSPAHQSPPPLSLPSPSKSPPALLSSTTSSFCVDELVWGAARGHPAWPGKIVQPPEGVATSTDSTWVQWFGGRPHHIELVAIASLKSLSEGLDAHHKAQKDTRK